MNCSLSVFGDVSPVHWLRPICTRCRRFRILTRAHCGVRFGSIATVRPNLWLHGMDCGCEDFSLGGSSCEVSRSFLNNFGTWAQFHAGFGCATPSVVAGTSTYAFIVSLYTLR